MNRDGIEVCHEPAHAPVEGVVDPCLPAGSGQADIGQSPLLLEPGKAAVVERALIRKQALLPARQKDEVKLQSLRRMKGHDRNALALVAAVDVHDQRHMLEKRPKIGKFAHRTDELLQIVEPSGRIGRALRFPHVDIAALLKNQLRQLFMRDLIRLSPPPIEVVEEAPQNLTGTRFQFLGFDERARRARQGEAGSPAISMQGRKRRFAEAAFGLVIDTLEGEVVVGLGDAAKIGQRVAYFRPLVESRAADDLVRAAPRR